MKSLTAATNKDLIAFWKDALKSETVKKGGECSLFHRDITIRTDAIQDKTWSFGGEITLRIIKEDNEYFIKAIRSWTSHDTIVIDTITSEEYKELYDLYESELSVK